jgi:hypothetical protein
MRASGLYCIKTHFIKCTCIVIYISFAVCGPPWSWSYGSWIYNCLSPLTLWVRIALRRDVLDTTLCYKLCQWLATSQWFSPGTPVSSTNETDHLDITDILLKVALNTITWILIYLQSYDYAKYKMVVNSIFKEKNTL